MRVAIVNDLPIAVEAIRRAVIAAPGHTIAWIATDGAQAVVRAKEDPPDVILMDMVMPGMDGVEATRRIMADAPCPIVVVTATVEGNASRVYDALGHGALDAVRTPAFGPKGDVEGAQPLLRKLAHVALLTRRESRTAGAQEQPTLAPRDAGGQVAAIGASTGGPQAALTVLRSLGRPYPAPILLVQHLGAEFVPGLAQWLADSASLPVRLVSEPEPLRPGTVYLAGREAHLVCTTPGVVGLSDEPADALHRPSVDVLFDSLLARGMRGVAALLTGMGRDGAEGLLRLRRAGWWTIAQDRPTSVVWGMPGEAVRIGAAVETIGIGMIGHAMTVAMARGPVSAGTGGAR